jgi:integrase/recombinase XerC
MASVFKRKGDKRWTIAYFDHEGNRHEQTSGTTDKRLAERIAASMSDRELERSRGLVDPAVEKMAAERSRPLSQQFDDYEAHLESLRRDSRHIEGTLAYLRAAAKALDWRTLASVDAHALATHLSDRAEQRGTGARTFNAAAAAWRAFGRWCARNNRWASNPLAGVGSRNVDEDRRRVRRDASVEEVTRIIAAAVRTPIVSVPKRVRNAKGELRTTATRMNYPERVWAYRVAAGTGFRAGEVASLKPESFDLSSDPPTVTVEAAYSKRKRRDVQPIRPDLAELLRRWLSGKPAGEPVCPLPEGKAALLLRADMDAARQTWLDEALSPSERATREASEFLRHVDAAGRVVDFHSLRVHYVSRVVEAGANVKEAMELARHSDPKLTLKTYARTGLHSLTRVLDGMPGTQPKPATERQTMRATGTDGRTFGPGQCPQKSPHSQRGMVRDDAADREEAIASGEASDGSKGLRLKGLRDSTRGDAESCENAPRRTRTFDPLIKSQLLYQLS